MAPSPASRASRVAPFTMLRTSLASPASARSAISRCCFGGNFAAWSVLIASLPVVFAWHFVWRPVVWLRRSPARSWGHSRHAVQLLGANTKGPAPATAGRSVWGHGGGARRTSLTLDYHPTRSVIFYGSMIAALGALNSASVARSFDISHGWNWVPPSSKHHDRGRIAPRRPRLPNCGQTMVLAQRIRRAFADDSNVFQCRMCGTAKIVRRPSKPAK
jgi:hypothetical protein